MRQTLAEQRPGADHEDDDQDGGEGAVEAAPPGGGAFGLGRGDHPTVGVDFGAFEEVRAGSRHEALVLQLGAHVVDP